jgi:hypothetical protein
MGVISLYSVLWDQKAAQMFRGKTVNVSEIAMEVPFQVTHTLPRYSRLIMV